LIFELASEDRLNILLLLKKTPLKLSHISAKLDFTVQETSRNITRLSEAVLIMKDVDGLFHLTPYGEEALNLLSGFKFIFKNRDYFASHTLGTLPPQFRNSIGLLESSDNVTDIMTTFHNIELMITRAEEFVWILSNQILASSIPYLEQAVERGVQFRLILPKDYMPTESMRQLIKNPTFLKAVQTGKLDVKSVERIDVFLCVSEKEISALAFPTPQAKIEYGSFNSTNKNVLEWARSLFVHYWNQASQVPAQLNQRA
jgi:predicted transcriptional regulator